MAAPGGRLGQLARTDTGRAAALAGAVAAGNAVSLLFTVVFARLLGVGDYGSLAALLSAFLILSLPGSALQTALARDLSRARDDDARRLEARARAAVRQAALLTVALLVAGVVAREPLADLVGVDDAWAAAWLPAAAGAWLLVSVQRGALQGRADYAGVGASFLLDAAGRFAIGAILLAAGFGVAGVFAGTALSLAAVAVVLERRLGPRLVGDGPGGGGLGALVATAGTAAVALALLAWLQNVDVVVVKHEVGRQAAGSWAAASLLSKAIVWIAVGLGLYLLPESARQADHGPQVRRLLVRVLALATAAGLPPVVLYAVAGDEILRLVFGADFVGGAPALPWLALAMALLAVSYLLVQHLLALRRSSFLAVLAMAAVAEPVLLAAFGHGMAAMAMRVTAVQAVLAAVLLGRHVLDAARRDPVMPERPATLAACPESQEGPSASA